MVDNEVTPQPASHSMLTSNQLHFLSLLISEIAASLLVFHLPQSLHGTGQSLSSPRVPSHQPQPHYISHYILLYYHLPMNCVWPQWLKWFLAIFWNWKTATISTIKPIVILPLACCMWVLNTSFAQLITNIQPFCNWQLILTFMVFNISSYRLDPKCREVVKNWT